MAHVLDSCFWGGILTELSDQRFVVILAESWNLRHELEYLFTPKFCSVFSIRKLGFYHGLVFYFSVAPCNTCNAIQDAQCYATRVRQDKLCILLTVSSSPVCALTQNGESQDRHVSIPGNQRHGRAARMELHVQAVLASKRWRPHSCTLGLESVRLVRRDNWRAFACKLELRGAANNHTAISW